MGRQGQAFPAEHRGVPIFNAELGLVHARVQADRIVEQQSGRSPDQAIIRRHSPRPRARSPVYRDPRDTHDRRHQNRPARSPRSPAAKVQAAPAHQSSRPKADIAGTSKQAPEPKKPRHAPIPTPAEVQAAQAMARVSDQIPLSNFSL